jgi:hypothetical protein
MYSTSFCDAHPFRQWTKKKAEENFDHFEREREPTCLAKRTVDMRGTWRGRQRDQKKTDCPADALREKGYTMGENGLRDEFEVGNMRERDNRKQRPRWPRADGV